MNTKDNARFREMENRIRTAFETLLSQNPPEKITVSRICEQAGIHRTTFYGHYSDVYDLIEHMLHTMYASVLQGIQSAEGDYLTGGLMNMLQYIRLHKSFFKNYLHMRAINPSAMPTVEHQAERHVAILVENMDESEKQDTLYRYAFFSAGLSNMVERWVARDCAEEPETILRVALHPADFLKKVSADGGE